MRRFVIFAIYLITFLVYTQGYWERFAHLPVREIIEVIVLMLAVVSFRPKIGLGWMALILVSGIIASIGTDKLAEFVKYIRFFFYFFVVYTALWNTRFSEKEFCRYVRFLVAMVLLQGVASIINIAHWGVTEAYVGAMSSLGGTTATAFPLLVFCVLLVVFYCSSFKKKSWYAIILLMIASIFIMAFGSGKRAVFFYIPAFLVGISVVCASYFKVRVMNIKILWVIAFAAAFIPIYIFAITQTAGVRDQLSGDENRAQVVKAMFEYAMFYEDAEDNGVTIGRSNTTAVILNHALASKEGWFMGNGFGTMKDEDKIRSVGVGYGFVGFSRDVFSGGVVFAVLVALFMVFLIFRRSTQIKDKFSTVLRFTILVVFIVIHFTYSSDFTVHLKINMLLAPLLCFLNSANYSHLKVYSGHFLINEIQ